MGGLSIWVVVSPLSDVSSNISQWLRWQRICLRCGRPGSDPWVGKIPWRREWLLLPAFLLAESHGQRSLVGYSPWCHKQSDTTERLTLSLPGFPCGSVDKESACNATDLGSVPRLGRSSGEGNGNPYSIILAWRTPWTKELGDL